MKRLTSIDSGRGADASPPRGLILFLALAAAIAGVCLVLLLMREDPYEGKRPPVIPPSANRAGD